jgi:hypothetical protein
MLISFSFCFSLYAQQSQEQNSTFRKFAKKHVHNTVRAHQDIFPYGLEETENQKLANPRTRKRRMVRWREILQGRTKQYS